MSKKFKISICSGTMCYVMGGARMAMLESIIPANLKDEVELTGSTCLEACSKPNAKPPFVKINDFIMEDASPEKVVEYLQKHIGG